MKNLKCYLHTPFLRKRKTKEQFFLGTGIGFFWGKYDFKYCYSSDGEYYPKAAKEGHHKFTFSISIMHWSIAVVFYTPLKAAQLVHPKEETKPNFTFSTKIGQA